MKIYIAGKITGLERYEYEAKFSKADYELRRMGHIPLNPTLLPQGLMHKEYLHICYSMIDVCDGILLLDNWQQSIGAKKEIRYAQQHHKHIWELKKSGKIIEIS